MVSQRLGKHKRRLLLEHQAAKIRPRGRSFLNQIIQELKLTTADGQSFHLGNAVLVMDELKS